MNYYSLNDYLKKTYGHKIYKLALNGGMSCPNRDGTIGTGGCIFCSESGSGDFAAKAFVPISQQIEQAKQRVQKKIKTNSYIAYFQAYTNTYAPVDYLEKIFMEAINHPDIEILSIATRPDCLDSDVINLLDRLNRIKPVWVELGLQSIHSPTVKYIRRGYDMECYDTAVKRLKGIGVNVITHVILGLPYETREMMLETVDYVGKSGSDGIKLQLLHVLEGTDLAEEYRQGKFEILTMEEYIDILIDCIRILPKNIVVHRLTGDGDKRILIAPLWSGDKKRVLNEISKRVAEAE